MTYLASCEVFCDWLDVTFSPDDYPLPELSAFLLSVGGKLLGRDEGVFRVGSGVVKLDLRHRWARASASGGVLAELRAAGRYHDYLSILASAPHRVTRLDAALDRDEEGPAAVARYRAQYPQTVKLSHKPIRVSSMLAPNWDGVETGTWYAGHRGRVAVSARVYDKQWELYEKTGELIPPRTRYELTFRDQVKPTLRDASEPARLFWHYASPALLPAPAGIEAWVSGWGGGWSYEPPTVDPARILAARVGDSAELGAWIELADTLGPNGRGHLLSLIRRRLAERSDLCDVVA